MKVHYQSKVEHLESDKISLEKQLALLREEILSADRHHSTETSSSKNEIASLQKQLTDTKEKLLLLLEEQKLTREV